MIVICRETYLKPHDAQHAEEIRKSYPPRRGSNIDISHNIDKMRSEHCIVGALALSPVALGVNIFVSHFSGTVSTLSLTTSNNGVNYALAANSSLTLGSPAQPSWLTFNSTTRTLWVSDEYWGSASIFTVNASPNGSLQQASKTPAAVNGAVASGQYGGGKFLANAH